MPTDCFFCHYTAQKRILSIKSGEKLYRLSPHFTRYITAPEMSMSSLYPICGIPSKENIFCDLLLRIAGIYRFLSLLSPHFHHYVNHFLVLRVILASYVNILESFFLDSENFEGISHLFFVYTLKAASDSLHNFFYLKSGAK